MAIFTPKFLIIFILGLTKLNAQIHEVGVFLGGSNYIGDVGKTNYINPNELSFGFLLDAESVTHNFINNLFYSILTITVYFAIIRPF